MIAVWDALWALEGEVLAPERARRDADSEEPKLQDIVKWGSSKEADVARAMMRLWDAYEELADTQRRTPNSVAANSREGLLATSEESRRTMLEKLLYRAGEEILTLKFVADQAYCVGPASPSTEIVSEIERVLGVELGAGG